MRTAKTTQLPALLAALLVSCAQQGTQLLVVVDTDVRPSSISSVQVFVEDFLDASGERVEHEFSPPDAFPMSFGVLPPSDDYRRRVGMAVVLNSPTGAEVRHIVTSGFIEGRTLTLPVFLSASCLSASCGAGDTCGPSGCEPIQDIDPATLSVSDGSGEPNGGTTMTVLVPAPPAP